MPKFSTSNEAKKIEADGFPSTRQN